RGGGCGRGGGRGRGRGRGRLFAGDQKDRRESERSHARGGLDGLGGLGRAGRSDWSVGCNYGVRSVFCGAPSSIRAESVGDEGGGAFCTAVYGERVGNE